MDGVEYHSLADVCEAAMNQPSPVNFVTEAAKQMPAHRTSGKLLFPITSALRQREHWKKDTFWTTGMSTRATPLREDVPGQNVLATVFKNAHVQPLLREHDYA